MSKSNSIVTDINRLLVYCDYKFHTRKVSVLTCLKALEYDAIRYDVTEEQFLDAINDALATASCY